MNESIGSGKLVSFFRRYWVLALLVSVKLILQFVLVNPVYELHRDEFLHLDQAFHPAAGYISVPPFSSWISDIIYLLGGSLFWIRFFPAFFGALTVILAWLIVEEAGGRLPAKILTSVFLIFSVYVRLNVLFQPNSFDILAWTMIFYFCIRYVKIQKIRWLIVISVIAALALYNKYNVIFLIAGLLGGFLISSQRRVFTTGGLYVALLLCVVLVLPNIVWQVRNGFPVMHHMEALKRTQLVNVNRIDFLIDQIKFGGIGVLSIASFVAFIVYKPFRPYRFIGWAFLIVILLYTYSRAKSYYALGLYPVLFALGSVYLEAVFKKWRYALFTLLTIINIGFFLAIVKYMMPYQSPAQIIANHSGYEKLGMLRWEDGENHALPQDFADMLGWREMAEKALKAYQMIPSGELDKTLIYCDNYGQVGALNYYNRGKMPEAYSFNTDYIYWLPVQKQIKNIVFVGQLPSKEELEQFAECRMIGTVDNDFARENGTKIFLLLGGNESVTEMFYRIARERKKNFDIF
jgi:4-amino-4-deoxy-L-arabinose transferase and related glycosyltransferases of PMT family